MKQKITQLHGHKPVPPQAEFVPFTEQDTAQSVGARFRSQVELHASRPAVVSDNMQLSYSELDILSDNIAHALLQQFPDEVASVALFLEQDALAIAAMLGVLKAGGFYVALDPDFPEDRNRYLINDSEARVLLTDTRNHLVAEQLSGEEIPLINLNELDLFARQPRALPDVDADAIACLIYTSGSTGEPKGVIHTHRTLLHNALRNTNTIQITASDRQTLLYPPNVVPAMRDTYVALMNGAALYPYAVKKRGFNGIAQWLEDEAITLYCSGVTVFRNFVKTLDAHKCFQHVRLVKLGGELIHKNDIGLFRQHFPRNAVFYSGLGTSETGSVTRNMILPDEMPAQTRIPLGVPLENMQVELHDDDGDVITDQRSGEIVVRSRYLSRGYWQQPELTDQKFTWDKAQPDAGLYYTGDIGRFDEHGCLEYLGRKEGFVKLKGNRVELSEIESCLMHIDGISNAVVVANNDDPQHPYLAAYVTQELAEPMGNESLRRLLQDKLPIHMVPNYIITLPALPLTPNGKPDRKALPSLFDLEYTQPDEYITPRNPTEAELALIWHKVLGRNVSVTENFFASGNDSLTAIYLLTEIENRLGVHMPLTALLEAPSIEKQAQYVNCHIAQAHQPLLTRLNKIKTGTPIFCAPCTSGYPMRFLQLAGQLDNNPVYGIRFPGLDGKQPAIKDVPQLAKVVLDEITARQPHGPYYFVGHSFGGTLIFEMARQLNARGEHVALLALLDSFTADAIKPSALLVYRVEKLWRLVAELWQDPQLKQRSIFLRPFKVANNILKKVRSALALRHNIKTSKQAIYKVQAGAAHGLRHYKNYQSLNVDACLLCRAEPLPGQPRLWRKFLSQHNGWNTCFGDNMTIVQVPGDHLDILYEPGVHVIADLLKRKLATLSD